MPTTPHTPFEPSILETLPHKTPFFLVSFDRILDKLNEFRDCFPGAAIHYAMKANSEQEVLKTLVGADCSFEVASVYELNLLKAINVPPQNIVYGTSVKPAEHIKEFVDYGVDRFAFDSLPELEKIAATAPGSRVYVRISVNDTGSVFRFSEKFGTDKENIVPLLQRAKELGLQPYGVSFHVGSQASNPMSWANALSSLREPMQHLQKVGITLEVINIGGGYPCMYASTEENLELKEIARTTFEAHKKLPYQPKLILEPGRGIIATAAVAVATVVQRLERHGITWLFLDAGVYNAFFEAMAYQGSTRYKVTSMRHSYNAGETMFALAGPTGDSWDIITRETLLPQDIQVGDKLIFHDVGAYSLVVTSPFNGFPKPSVYYV